MKCQNLRNFLANSVAVAVYDDDDENGGGGGDGDVFFAVSARRNPKRFIAFRMP